MWKKCILVIGLVFIMSSTLFAKAMTLGDYQDKTIPHSDPRFQTFITGLGYGIFYTNLALELNGAVCFFTVPANMPLGYQTFTYLIDQELIVYKNSKKYVKETPIGCILFNAMVHYYPVKKP